MFVCLHIISGFFIFVNTQQLFNSSRWCILGSSLLHCCDSKSKRNGIINRWSNFHLFAVFCECTYSSVYLLTRLNWTQIAMLPSYMSGLFVRYVLWYTSPSQLQGTFEGENLICLMLKNKASFALMKYIRAVLTWRNKPNKPCRFATWAS